MIRYSCDMCGAELDARNDLRYVLRLEVYAACDVAENAELSEDSSGFQELQDILRQAEDEQNDQIGQEVYHQQRYDLCPSCRKRFMKNPLGRGQQSLEFSKN